MVFKIINYKLSINLIIEMTVMSYISAPKIKNDKIISKILYLLTN